MSEKFAVNVFVDTEPGTIRELARELRVNDSRLDLELHDNESAWRIFSAFRSVARTLKDIPHGFVRLGIVIIYLALAPAIVLIMILGSIYRLVSPNGRTVNQPARFVLTIRSDVQSAVFSALQLVERRLQHPFVASVSSPLRDAEEHSTPDRVARETLREASSLHALPSHMRIDDDVGG